MALDDAIRRAQAETDKVDKARRTEEEFQAGRVPHGVDLMRGLLRDAARGFEDARVKPTHVLRELHGGRNSLLNRLRSPERKYEKLARGWQVGRWLLGDEGTLYHVYGHHFSVRSVTETKHEHSTGDLGQRMMSQARGLLRLGLNPGDQVTFVDGIGQGECRPIDIPAEMSASKNEAQEEYGSGAQSWSNSFVVSPSGTIFARDNDCEHTWYKRLEDLLGAAIVSQAALQ